MSFQFPEASGAISVPRGPSYTSPETCARDGSGGRTCDRREIFERQDDDGIDATCRHIESGEEIIFANSELLKSRIRNYRASFERWVVFSLGVTYETSHARLARIPTILREIIEGQEHARFERAHFVKLAESLIFEAAYYVLSSDETLFMDVQQAINLALYARLQREGIALAAPHAIEVRESTPAILPKSA